MPDESIQEVSKPIRVSSSKAHYIAKTLGILFNIYIVIAVLIFGPYYNWQYAQENGFVKWFFLGEIAPTGKALAWPYFVTKHYREPPPPQWTQEDKENAQHILASWHADLAAIQISRTKGADSVSEEDKQSILQLKKAALREALAVKDEVLDKGNPDLKQHFRGEYQSQLRLRIQGIEQRDTALEKQSIVFQNQWVDWYSANQDKIDIFK